MKSQEQAKAKNQVVLEHSSNTHIAESTGRINVEDLGNNEALVTPEGGTIAVRHGEHGTIGMKNQFHKINQVEYNPIQRVTQQAFD